MIRNYLMPFLAVAGFAIAGAAAWHYDNPEVAGHSTSPGAKSPFANQVAGIGVVETNGGNVAIGTPVPGIVKAIPVRWGDHVRAGEVLFRIDDADLRARLPAAEARVTEAETKLAQARNALSVVERLPDRRAVSTEEVDNRRLAVKINQAAVAVAHAGVEEIALERQRRTVRAPASGQVLQIRSHPGEYVDGATPLMLVGDDSRRQLRVEIDQHDAARIRAGAPAQASLFDAPSHRVTLKFERVEPMVLPKTALVGAVAERIDTRVLQVIYSFDNKDLAVYVGQQMDVFIDAGARGAP